MDNRLFGHSHELALSTAFFVVGGMGSRLVSSSLCARIEEQRSKLRSTRTRSLGMVFGDKLRVGESSDHVAGRCSTFGSAISLPVSACPAISAPALIGKRHIIQAELAEITPTTTNAI